MKMKRKVCGLAAAGAFASCLPGAAAAAVQIAGEALQIQGRLHLSADLSNADSTGAANTPPDGTHLSLSSNSSYLGLFGRHDLDPEWTLIWQVEQEIRPDEGSGNFATRNTFVGVTNAGVGTLLAGHYDTPFKSMGKRWSVLSYTVADRRSILGAGALSNNVMNQRARNSLLYMNTIEGVEFQVMYATDGQDSRPGLMDDNDNDVFSGAVWFTFGALELSAAYEHWSNLNTGVVPNPSGRADGLRLAARHGIGGHAHVGVILETIDTSAAIADLDRNAFGINGGYRVGANLLEAQLIFAGDHRGQGSSGAMNLGVGLTRQVTPQTAVYGAFALTDNDSNARYRVADGGHGDEVDTVPGGSPFSLSAGFVFRF